MFSYCTRLVAAPALPATSVSQYCYDHMFYGCTSLTAAPDLPAATVPNYAYRNMFEECGNLTSIKCLATSRGTDSVKDWLKNVSASGTFTKASGSSWPTGTSGIPSGWAVLEV